MKKIKRALSAKEVMNYRGETLGFTGRWRGLIGEPELKGSWIIWGKSGNGKTRFALQLAGYLATFGHVIYDSVEEGLSTSLRKAIEESGLQSATKLTFLDMENLEVLTERLKRERSPKVVIIDSLQHAGLSKKQYDDLRTMFPRKLFIWISHAAGSEPAGKVAAYVRYDSNVKIHISNYYANAMSRYGGGEPYDIWPERGI